MGEKKEGMEKERSGKEMEGSKGERKRVVKGCEGGNRKGEAARMHQ